MDTGMTGTPLSHPLEARSDLTGARLIHPSEAETDTLPVQPASLLEQSSTDTGQASVSHLLYLYPCLPLVV